MSHKQGSDLKRVFVAAPFTQAVRSDGSFDPDLRRRIEFLIAHVRTLGCKVFSSHVREDWGEQLDRPADLAAIDREELNRSTHVVAFFSAVPSPGVFLEMGIAIGLALPILAIVDEHGDPSSDFYRGLVDIGVVQELRWTSSEVVAARVTDFVENQ